MEHPNARAIPGQFLRRFLVGDHLPFLPLLDIDGLAAQVERHVGRTRDRIDTPLVTLAMFLRQIVDRDHSCRAAVEHLAAARAAAGLPPGSDDTGAYCKARQRLPEALLCDLATEVGGDLRRQAGPDRLFHGRPVKIVDGTGSSMPDTPDNRRAFATPGGQKLGVAFPMARVLVVVCLACGAALDAVVGPCPGKRSGECAAPRGLRDRFERGDIALGDGLYGSFLDVALLAAAGVDVVFGMHARRRVDFRRGRRLGPDDHVVDWTKPPRPEWLDQAAYDALPAAMAVRELRLWVARAGFRTRVIRIATTLLDPAAFPKADLAGLSRARWQVGLDIRSLKPSMAMDVLRCKTEAMVRKEIWAHLLAYNLIRGAMAAAARQAALAPRELSFRGTCQTLGAFADRLSGATAPDFAALCELILGRLAAHRVGDRPGRFEPRERRRRPKKSKYMQFPRNEARVHAALRS